MISMLNLPDELASHTTAASDLARGRRRPHTLPLCCRGCRRVILIGVAEIASTASQGRVLIVVII